ncbi:hypothetical protein [Cryptosporangium aurantiacum]|uniref:Uncharacterized protein n=1 Tax=Cryptosporangium aurantiacum TaxID=134849 RepID=A0A1M7IQK6_9ACTN|nr:hypothetical protein [Cryptosporangium aurantiacum]SHM43094.1 hypothetical protein SAMN05443668_101566 [Cryptosporangium aurantiacum]
MTSSDPAADATLRAGWSSACGLYEHLSQGGTLRADPRTPLRLRPDENHYATAVLGYARFYGTTVEYQQSSSLWFGSPAFVLGGLAVEAITNQQARNRAAAMAAVQWRDHALVRTALTDQRILCDHGGEWLSFWHEGAQELVVDLTRWAFVLRFEVGAALMLHGPAAPWFAVAVSWLVYGPRGLEMPGFAPLVAAIAARRATIQQAPRAIEPGAGDGY